MDLARARDVADERAARRWTELQGSIVDDSALRSRRRSSQGTATVDGRSTPITVRSHELDRTPPPLISTLPSPAILPL